MAHVKGGAIQLLCILGMLILRAFIAVKLATRIDQGK